MRLWLHEDSALAAESAESQMHGVHERTAVRAGIETAMDAETLPATDRARAEEFGLRGDRGTRAADQRAYQETSC